MDESVEKFRLELFVERYVRASVRVRPDLTASELLRLVAAEFGMLYTWDGMRSLMSG